MKENLRIVLIIGASFALLELLCPPTDHGRLFFGINTFPNTNPILDITSIAMHIAIISVVTLIVSLLITSPTLMAAWEEMKRDYPPR